MNLEELIRSFRALSRDKYKGNGQTDLLTLDEDLKEWLNEAQDEACVRARLIREESLAEVCRIPLTVGTHTYALHPSVYEIISIRLLPGNGMPSRELELRTREWLDAYDCGWRDWDTRGRIPAQFVIQDDTSIRITGYSELDDQLVLECYRLPLEPMCRDNDEPEIHTAHHRKLVQWALYRAFGVPDSDLFDPDRSEKANREFTAHFGLPVDADLRRSTRIDVPHHTTQSIV